AHREQRIVALSPDAVLGRGYSITQDAETGSVLIAAEDTRVDRRIRIRLATGHLGARVDEVKA
ncbi:MAG TPA: exodeoxyribonuclease VII large subunit, partial [Candidatus Dormibacteraeota bacterium]